MHMPHPEKKSSLHLTVYPRADPSLSPVAAVLSLAVSVSLSFSVSLCLCLSLSLSLSFCWLVIANSRVRRPCDRDHPSFRGAASRRGGAAGADRGVSRSGTQPSAVFRVPVPRLRPAALRRAERNRGVKGGRCSVTVASNEQRQKLDTCSEPSQYR